MLGVTDRDRQEIRTGRNRAIGAQHARLLFWAPIWGRLLLAVVPAVLVILLAVKAHAVWVGGLDQAVYSDWPLWLVGAVFVGLFAALAFPVGSSPRRRRRRPRHGRRYR